MSERKEGKKEGRKMLLYYVILLFFCGGKGAPEKTILYFYYAVFFLERLRNKNFQKHAPIAEFKTDLLRFSNTRKLFGGLAN